VDAVAAALGAVDGTTVCTRRHERTTDTIEGVSGVSIVRHRHPRTQYGSIAVEPEQAYIASPVVSCVRTVGAVRSLAARAAIGAQTAVGTGGRQAHDQRCEQAHEEEEDGDGAHLQRAPIASPRRAVSSIAHCECAHVTPADWLDARRQPHNALHRTYAPWLRCERRAGKNGNEREKKPRACLRPAKHEWMHGTIHELRQYLLIMASKLGSRLSLWP
jgi:hypothetical protein